MVWLRDKRTLVLVVAVILAALAFRIGWGLYGAQMFGTEEVEAQAQAQGDCSELTAIGPETTNQRLGPFELGRNTVRVSGEARSLDPDIPPIFNIALLDQEGVPAGVGASIQEEGPFEENILVDRPGTYSLEITTFSNVEYSVTASECGSSPPGGPGGDTTPQPSPGPGPSPSPPPAPQPKAPPLKAGGPKDGPVPAMPSGECPKEFPVDKGKECYR